MLGVCLLFVGIVLINNGMCSLYNVDGKSTAIMNIFTGGLSLFINFVNLVQGLLCSGNGITVLLYLPFCGSGEISESKSDSFCMVFYFCSSQCGDLWDYRGGYRKQCAGYHTGSAMGSNLVSLGDSLGNCLCGGHLWKEAWKICSISSGV